MSDLIAKMLDYIILKLGYSDLLEIVHGGRELHYFNEVEKMLFPNMFAESNLLEITVMFT